MFIGKQIFLISSAMTLTLFAGCSKNEEATATSPNHREAESTFTSDRLPYAFSKEGKPIYRDGNSRHLRDYTAALNALSVLATVSRDSEYGHPAYQPDWRPEVMGKFAEAWLDMVREIQTHFLSTGGLPASVGEEHSAEVDLSLLPHLAYAYHIHHRSGRFSANPALENRLNREASQLLVAPGRYLIDNHYREGRFTDTDGQADFKSMAYGLGGLHGTAYAWVSWAKPDGEDDMGTLPEDHLAAFLGIRPEALADLYREVDDYLLQHWSPERAIYVFDEEDDALPLDAIGAMFRGKKAMGDVLYMFGGDEGKERSAALFERLAATLDAVFPVARPWGMPDQLVFGEDGVTAAAETVDLYEWYQFLNHLGGGYAFDREREGTARYFDRHRPDLLEAWNELTDEALLGIMEYHVTSEERLARTVSYEDGQIFDDQLTLATMAMFITTAGNLYGKGSAFARPGEWAEGDPEIAEQSRQLFDLSFAHWDLLKESTAR